MSQLLFLWILFSRHFINCALVFEEETPFKLPRIAIFFRWICQSDAVVVPSEVEVESSTRIRRTEYSSFFENGLVLKMDGNYQISDQFSISNNNIFGCHEDRSFQDVFLKISQFLNTNEALNLRLVNKTFLFHYTLSSRSQLLTSIKPRISFGFNILQGNPHSASYLIVPLCKLLNRNLNNYLEIAVDPDVKLHSEIEKYKRIILTTNNLTLLIFNGLLFLYRTDFSEFLELFDAVVKAKIFSENGYYLFKFSSVEIFICACKMGYFSTVKAILERPQSIQEESIINGLNSCIEKGYSAMFKYIFSHSNFIITNENVEELIKLSIFNERSEIFKYLLEKFPFLSNCLFLALNTKNLEIIEFILYKRGPSDYKTFSPDDELNVLEVSAKLDHLEGLQLLFQFPLEAEKLLKRPDTFRSAIRFKSKKCVPFFISKIGIKLDHFYQLSQVSFLLIEAIQSKQVDILKLLLDSIETKSFEDLDSNIIQLVIRDNFQEAFELLIEHFGSFCLVLPDSWGRNSFMNSFIYEQIYFVHRIVSLKPEILNRRDINRNTALHLLLLLGKCPGIEFLKDISKLKLDWLALNNEKVTPVHLLNRYFDLISSEDIFEIYNNILSNLII